MPLFAFDKFISRNSHSTNANFDHLHHITTQNHCDIQPWAWTAPRYYSFQVDWAFCPPLECRRLSWVINGNAQCRRQQWTVGLTGPVSWVGLMVGDSWSHGPSQLGWSEGRRQLDSRAKSVGSVWGLAAVGLTGQVSWVGLRVGSHLGAILHLSNEPYSTHVVFVYWINICEVNTVISSSKYDPVLLSRTSCCCHLSVIDKLMMTVAAGLL